MYFVSQDLLAVHFKVRQDITFYIKSCNTQLYVLPKRGFTLIFYYYHISCQLIHIYIFEQFPKDHNSTGSLKEKIVMDWFLWKGAAYSVGKTYFSI